MQNDHTKCLTANPKGGGHLGDLDVCRRVILKWILNCVYVHRIELAQDRIQ
jgi:hypothetical protein